MSKHEKLIAKLPNKQVAFTWQELGALLRGLGYSQIEEDGSRAQLRRRSSGCTAPALVAGPGVYRRKHPKVPRTCAKHLPKNHVKQT